MNLPVRGLWVVRTSITSQERIERLVELSVRHGVNSLVVQVRGRGDAYYSNGLEPRAETLDEAPEEFDPLSAVLKQVAGTGIRVHAWLNAHFAWEGETPPRSPQHLVNRHPEWLMRRRSGEVTFRAGSDVEGAYTCPSNSEARHHLAAVYLDIARRYAVDGVHFDYIRYPSPDYCFCETCAMRFRQHLQSTAGEDTGGMPTLEAVAAANPAAWDTFRRDQITELVRHVYRQVKEEREDILVSAAVFANADDAFKNRFQDWKSWLKEGILDVVCPMAYTTDTAIFGRQLEEAAAAAGEDQAAWAGVGAYRVEAADCLTKIEKARDAGARGILLFSYGAITGEGAREDYLEALRLAPV